MRHRTPLRAIAKWAAALDIWIFATDDRCATARAWQVDRSSRFTRTYRDPRWDLVGPPEPVHAGARSAPLPALPRRAK